MRTLTAICILLVILAGACRKRPFYHASTGAAVQTDGADSVNPHNDEDPEIVALAKADSTLAGMTLEQKVGQCFMPTIMSRTDSVNMRMYREYIHDMKVGGIVLLKGNLQAAATMAGMGVSATVPLFVGIDAEWGLGMRLEDAPVFPRNGIISGGADEHLLYEYGAEVARECRRVGINMVLGPVVDVVQGSGGIIGSRAFGRNPDRVAALGVAYAHGLEEGGVLSVAKHFPGHGSQTTDSHLHLPVLTRTFAQLDSIDILPFRRFINSGLSGVMVGHIAVSAIDSVARPAAVSRNIIDGLLRMELSFNGLILTDALNMGAVEGFTAADAIEAGADIVVGPAETQWEIRNVVEKVKEGVLPAEEIDDRCRRILFFKYLLGLDRRRPMLLEGLQDDVRGESDSLRYRLSGK